MHALRRILRLSALGFAACNGYHLITSAARYISAQALRDHTTLDPDQMAALLAE